MLVLDANILIRAVLGSRVLFLIRSYAEQMEFLAPDTAFQEAREHLPSILERRKLPVAPAMAMLDSLAGLVQTVESET
jgi:predicted nucleic acid-binding protein